LDKSDADYLIGPGDVLSIDVWKEEELSKQVSVRLDGKISLPLVNDIEAAGLTLVQLREQLAEKYKDFVDVPEVSVTVIESRSKRIYLLGKVTRPGNFTCRGTCGMGGLLGCEVDQENQRNGKNIPG
jgi:polysaccharide export outer membrane protein